MVLKTAECQKKSDIEEKVQQTVYENLKQKREDFYSNIDWIASSASILSVTYLGMFLMFHETGVPHIKGTHIVAEDLFHCIYFLLVTIF